LDLQEEYFRIKFEHPISPDVLLIIKDSENIKVAGQVKIDLDTMLNSFAGGLGLKLIFEQLIKKSVNDDGYFLDIKGIALASISIKDEKLCVKAEYRASKEWWAKPIALAVLDKLLLDFAIKLEKCGVVSGFRSDIKIAMQDLRKSNSANLNLKNLFLNQTFINKSLKIIINDFNFSSVKTYSEESFFKINFLGNAKANIQSENNISNPNIA